jgi:flagellin
MGIVINTNVASLDAQRNLATAQGNLQRNLAHLSSGLRINSAADGAADLAISSELTAKVRSLDQANRNANDGISLAQVADGALNQVGGILTRMRELAVQSANGTLTANDRAFTNQEYGYLKNEIDRIASVTDFNGTKLLDGSTRSVALQVGSGTSASDQISINLFGGNQASGQVQYADPTAAVGTQGTMSFTVNGTGIDVNYSANDSLNSVVSAINNNGVLGNAGISASVHTANGQSNLVINSNSSLTAVSDSAGMFASSTLTPAYNANGGLASLTTGAIGAASINNQTVYLSASSVDSAVNASNAITNLDQAIHDVSSMRATLGASQNRLQVAVNNLSTASENFSAANSRIQDVDVASETASMTRNQILSQAGVAVLAQANQLPSAALSLLGH